MLKLLYERATIFQKFKLKCFVFNVARFEIQWMCERARTQVCEYVFDPENVIIAFYWIDFFLLLFNCLASFPFPSGFLVRHNYRLLICIVCVCDTTVAAVVVGIFVVFVLIKNHIAVVLQVDTTSTWPKLVRPNCSDEQRELSLSLSLFARLLT